MRRNLSRNLLVVVSDPTKALYDDRWEGETLHYTGMGKTGDQSFSSQNRTLVESLETNLTVHLFEVFTNTKYTYAGEVFLSGKQTLTSKLAKTEKFVK